MLKEQFSDEVIMADCIDDFRKDRPVEIGFGYSLERFFNLGFSVEKACDICVLDQNGCQYDAQDFAEVTLSLNWNDQQDREEPWDDLRPNHSTEEVAAILENKLGARIDLTPPKEAEQKEKTEQDYVQEFLRDLLIKGAGEQVIPEYTFSNIDYLAFWKEGDSLHPNVEKRLQKLKDTTIEIRENNKDTFDQFNECSEYDRIKWLISLNRYFLIRKDYWDYYNDNINQTDLSNTLFNILLVDAREIYTNHLCRALLNNRALLERFMI
ncbi:hypothetical protein [Gracilibacillus timonensis]|uniref:hypothetical protein n=1 Tax=Gracilibacillus timonensis TaxID=1816696 RepID=UPI0013727C09|nr:hypothetical protein [Gracilibacillus timonensis]